MLYARLAPIYSLNYLPENDGAFSYSKVFHSRQELCEDPLHA